MRHAIRDTINIKLTSNKQHMKKYLLLLLTTVIVLSGFSQNQQLIDSLSPLLITAKEDTTKANILNKLSGAYQGNDPDKAMEFAKQSLDLSEQIDFKKGIANAYNSMGIINRDNGNFLPALDFQKKALKVSEEIGYKRGIIWSTMGIGIIYHQQGNYPEALKNYFAALKIGEEIGDKRSIAGSYNNIGTVYREQGDYTEALKNFIACLKIKQEIGDKGDKKGIAGAYNNIGTVYFDQGNYPEALKNHLASLKIVEEIGNKQGAASSYINIGNVYKLQGNYPEAWKNYFTSSKIAEGIGDKIAMATSYNAIGGVYTTQNKYHDAYVYLNKALSLSKEIGSVDNINAVYDNLTTLDSAQGNFKQALEHHKLYIATRDSLLNNENTKKITQQQMQYDFDKKELATKAAQDKKDDAQRIIRSVLLGGLFSMGIFSIVFFRQRNKIAKGKKKSDELLLNILPAEVAEELKNNGSSEARDYEMATVMFTDFKDFTIIGEQLSPAKLVEEINECFSAFDNIIHQHNIEKIKTIGDAYMCAGGLPIKNATHAEDTIKAAIEIVDFMNGYNKTKTDKGEMPFEIRIGINTGPLVAGIVGVKKFAYDIWGDTVNIASRMESNSEAGKINISGATYELVKTKFNCVHRGKIEAKNKGEVDMYFVESSTNA